MPIDSEHAGPERRAITAVILAGGRGQRMGGRDKGLLSLSGSPLVAHVLRRIAPQVGSVVISANRHGDRYAALGCRVVADTMPGYLGPLAGLLAAFEAVQSEWLLTIPCDVPCLPADLVEKLAATAADRGATLVAPRTGGRIQAAILLAHRGEEAEVRAYLSAGERRARGFLEARGAAFTDFGNESGAFLNVNTPEELCELERVLSAPESPCR